MEINYIYQRIAHHSDHSGYDQLIKYVPSHTIAKNSIFSLLDFIPERMLAQVRRSAGEWYNSNALKWELQNIVYYWMKKNQVFHFLYGEDSFRYSGYLNLKKSNKIVVTYHNPPQKFDRIVPNKNHLTSIDAVVVVCSKQLEYFKSWVEAGKIHLIHHGVDTAFFHPLQKEGKKEKQCLFVGTHLRDFETLKEVIRQVNQVSGTIRFNIVTEKTSLGECGGLKNTYLFEQIREHELLDQYRESDVLLMPIMDCTANNSLLEAMACGLPVVTNDVGGVRDYVNDRCAVLVEPGNAHLMADRLLALLNDDDRRTAMSFNARENALRFDWKMIADQITAIYAA